MQAILAKFRRHKVPVPPPPGVLLALSKEEQNLYCPDRSPTADSPLATLYRIYWAILTNSRYALRNEIEYFWRRKEKSWSLHLLPDPQDPSLERYAVVAGATYLLAAAFNNLIERGEPRCAPAIMTREEELKHRAMKIVPERVPEWAERAPALETALILPDSDGQAPKSASDEGVDERMLKKNVLLYRLHIMFV